MCGLVGIMSSNMTMKHRDMLNDMLYFDTFRGRDSTGVAAVRYNGDTAVLKATVPGYEFTEGPQLNQFLRLNDFIWIGHNRFGTIGKNIKTNAHPFVVKDEDGVPLLVGAHNGTLKNKNEIPNHLQFGTDSEALFNFIGTDGLETAISKTDGAWALTYYDHVLEQMRFLRNKERPLCYAFSKDKKTFFWASEPWMIKVSAMRADVELEEGKVFIFNEDTLYHIEAPDKLNEELVLKKKGGVEGKPPFFFREQRWLPERWAHLGGKTSQQEGEEENQKTAPTKTGFLAGTNMSSGTKAPNLGLVQGPGNHNSPNSSKDKLYKGYSGKLISKTELEKILKNGCSWCGDDIFIDTKNYAWLEPDKPVCPKCMSGEHRAIETIEEACFGQKTKAAMN